MSYLAHWKSDSESPKTVKLADVIIYCCIHIKSGLEFGHHGLFLRKSNCKRNFNFRTFVFGVHQNQPLAPKK